MKLFVSTLAIVAWLALTGCGRDGGQARSAQAAEIDALMQQQIDLHLAMADVLDQVGDRKSYEEARPVIETMRKASEEASDLFAKLTDEQKADLMNRYGKDFLAARMRLEEARENSSNRLRAQLPDLNFPKKK